MADFFRGLAGGMQTGLQLGQQLRQRRMEDELAKAYAKPETSQGYTAETGQQLEALANTGAYDIVPQYGPAGEGQTQGVFTGYQAVPKAGLDLQGDVPAAPMSFNPQQVQEYGGRRVAGQFDPTQLRGLQMREAAGVLGRYGDVRGAAALEAQAAEQEYQARIRPLQEEQMRRQGLLTEGQLTEMNRNQARTKKIEDVDADVAQWQSSRLLDPNTNEPRQPTMDDNIAALQYRATALQKAGLAKEATDSLRDYQGFAVNQIKLDETQRNSQLGGVAAAIAAGDLGPAAAFYDRYVLDGAKVTGMKSDPKTGAITVSRVRDDGAPMPDKVIKGGANELLAALNSFKDPNKLYEFSQNEFNNNLKLRQVAAIESKAANARDLTGLNAKLINARIDNLNQRTQTLRNPPPPPLTEAQVTARARTMVTNREINPTTKKPYTTNEAVEFVKSGARDPVMDALNNLIGGNTDPFAD
jgi:hypothetical protein